MGFVKVHAQVGVNRDQSDSPRGLFNCTLEIEVGYCR